MKVRNNTNKFFDLWCVFLLIAASGLYYMQQLNMPITGVLMGVTALLIWKIKGNPLKINLVVALVIVAIVLTNVVINHKNGLNVNGIIILLLQLFFLIELTSNMSFSDYKELFVKIMVFEAILSVICYLWVDVFAISNLPLQRWQIAPTGPVNMTPYYVVGWSKGPFGRNAGWFGEPGAHQIFLNIALTYLLTDDNHGKKKMKSAVILIIAILTTQSTTGYMCMALVLASTMFLHGSNNNVSKVITIAGLIVLYYFESTTEIISHKMNGGGSYETRANDTVGGYMLALSSPFFGHGIYATNRQVLYAEKGITTISNGLASMAIGLGIVVVAIYLLCIHRGILKKMKISYFSCALFWVMLIFCMNSEGGAMSMIYLLWLFEFRGHARS